MISELQTQPSITLSLSHLVVRPHSGPLGAPEEIPGTVGWAREGQMTSNIATIRLCLTDIVSLMATEGGEFLRETRSTAVCKYEMEGGMRAAKPGYKVVYLIVEILYNIPPV